MCLLDLVAAAAGTGVVWVGGRQGGNHVPGVCLVAVTHSVLPQAPAVQLAVSVIDIAEAARAPGSEGLYRQSCHTLSCKFGALRDQRMHRACERSPGCIRWMPQLPPHLGSLQGVLVFQMDGPILAPKLWSP